MTEINPSQCKFLKILWKDSILWPTKVLQLLTVTYVTTCFPFLATKTSQQLALDDKRDFLLASKIALHDFYMNDSLSGLSKLHEFEKIQSKLTLLLQNGGMILHRWCTNKARTTELQVFQLDWNAEELTVKSLGI